MALGAAVPADAQQIFNDFRRNGTINPCNYSEGQLRQGLPPDILQYAPGLADQLAAGRAGCGGGGGGQPTAAVPLPTAPGAPPPSGPAAAAAIPIKIPAPPAPKAAARTKLANIETPTVPTRIAATEGSDVPGWLLPLLVCLSLVLLLFAGVRVGGWSFDRFTRPFKAGVAEGAGRSADALAQLRDRARFGR
jgi:hypothetical protein